MLNSTQDVAIDFKPLLTAKEFYWSALTLSWIMIVFSILGIVSNMIAVTAYYKIGFSESINISYFALGISDIGVLGTFLSGAILNILTYLEVDVPFDPMTLSGPAVYWPGEGLEKTTSCITAYISLERCLCILFPLHVKGIVTRKKTIIVILTIFVLVFAPSNIAYFLHDFEIKIDPALNKTILYIHWSPEPTSKIILEAMNIYFSGVLHFSLLCGFVLFF